MNTLPRPNRSETVRQGWIWLAIALCALPFFTSVVPPLADVSQHVLVARIILEHADPVLDYGRYFEVEWQGAATELFYVLFAALQKLSAPFWDARIYLTLWVALLWGSVALLARTVGHPSPRLAGLMALPLAFSWYVYQGLLPFLMTLPLFALAVAVWCSSWQRWPKLVSIWLLLSVTFGFHIVGAAAGAAAIGVIALVEVLQRRHAPAHLLLAGAAVLPVPLLLIKVFLGDRPPQPLLIYAGLVDNALTSIKLSVVSLSSVTTVLVLLWFGALLALALLDWRGLLARAPLLVAAAVLALLGLVLPVDMGALYAASPRLLQFSTMLLVVALPLARVPSHRLVVPVVGLLACMSLATVVHVRQIDREYRDLLHAVDAVEPGSRLLPVVIEPGAGARWTEPFWTVFLAYTVERGGVSPYVFAAPYVKTGGPPLRYRDREIFRHAFLYEPQRPASDYQGAGCCYDYVLIWGDAPEIEAALAAEFELQSRQGRAAMLRRRGDGAPAH